MTQTTFDQELDAHCGALLQMLDAAHVPYSRQPGGHAANAWVVLRPTLQAWQVRQYEQRCIEDRLRKEPERYQLCVWQMPDTGTWVAVVPLHALTMQFIWWGRHPACYAYCAWQGEVLSAISKHGYYNPATNHTPPPGEELDALERRETHRDLMNALIPGIGDALSGQRPTTEEGRRLLWHQAIDPDTGEVQMINDADLPDEEEGNDAEH